MQSKKVDIYREGTCAARLGCRQRSLVSVDERPFYACLFPPACLLFEPLLALSLIAKRLSALAHRLDDLCECDIHELVAAALW